MFVGIVLVNSHETKTHPLWTPRGLRLVSHVKCHCDFLRKWIRLDYLILFYSRTSKKLSVGVFDKLIKYTCYVFLPLVFVMFSIFILFTYIMFLNFRYTKEKEIKRCQ